MRKFWEKFNDYLEGTRIIVLREESMGMGQEVDDVFETLKKIL